MTAAKTAPTPSTYITGLCASGFHDRCRGAYAGCECTCPHHTAPAEPAVLGEIAAALTEIGTAVAVQHCPTCACGGAA